MCILIMWMGNERGAVLGSRAGGKASTSKELEPDPMVGEIELSPRTVSDIAF